MEHFLKRTFKTSLLLAAVILSTMTVKAQWQTQTVTLKPGWNAVYLHVDLQHETLANLLGSTPVTEVWLWKPDLSSLQFVTSPNDPLDTNSRWLSWKKAAPLDATISSFIGNAAYLIRLDEAEGSDYALNLKGKPVPPTYNWSSDGANFLGFSTVPVGAPSFYNFFEPMSELRSSTSSEIYKYVGGSISNNPKRIFNLRSEIVERGKAFWVRAKGVYNRYFAPFALDLQSSSGVGFGDQSSTYRIRLSNNTSNELTVSLADFASEAVPSGQTAIVAAPEIMVRGELDHETREYAFTRLSDEDSSWILAPQGSEGSVVEILLGLDRSDMTGASGGLFAGLLRFTDSLGYAQYDLPVSATKGDSSGLWVGEAAVSQVRHDLSFFERNGDDVVLTGTDTEFGPVARAFRLRVIIHVDADGNAMLLQRVYSGLDDALNPVLTIRQGNLNAESFELARRISAPHLPFTEDAVPWALTGGAFALGETLSTTVTLGADDHRSNPFLHAYHPDHDNQNATFSASLAPGIESFSVSRTLNLEFKAGGSGFAALTAGSIELGGDYSESIVLSGSGPDSNSYEVQGTFLLTRISDNPTLLTTLSE